MSVNVCSMHKRADNGLWEVHYPSPNKAKRKNAVQLTRYISDNDNIAKPICEILLYIAKTLKDDPLIMKALPNPGNKKITKDCENDIIMRKYRDILVSLIDDPKEIEQNKDNNPFVSAENDLIKNIKQQFQVC